MAGDHQFSNPPVPLPKEGGKNQKFEVIPAARLVSPQISGKIAVLFAHHESQIMSKII
jgi:hypothetical protein